MKSGSARETFVVFRAHRHSERKIPAERCRDCDDAHLFTNHDEAMTFFNNASQVLDEARSTEAPLGLCRPRESYVFRIVT